MSDRPKILCVGVPSDEDEKLLAPLSQHYEIVRVETRLRALSQLSRESFHAIHVYTAEEDEGVELARWTQSDRILQGMPDGVALLDADNNVVWANRRLQEWSGKPAVHQLNFYAVFQGPEILGPDFCPFHSALATGEPSGSLLRCAADQYFHVHAAPVREPSGPPKFLIVTVRDVTAETRQKQKIAAIHRAGLELSELSPDDIGDMRVEDRIELLKQNILHHTKDLLKFDVVEIRLMDPDSNELVPLLSVGMRASAAERALFASASDNGVTGFVAATGKSYLCEDTTKDPLYLLGCDGAKSSLTVPLIQHDDIIGTFNVESPKPRAFTESDLQFLEIFSRDVAVALNTLELLVAQQANTAQASVEAIHGEVALPVDAILNDAVNVMQHYIGHDADVTQRLQRILRNARDIKQVIQKVGQKMAPAEAVMENPEQSAWPRLKSSRVLVVDPDDDVRNSAHALLERFGCVVETAHQGEEAILMVQSAEESYDAIIADIRLPDYSGYQLLLKLQEILPIAPLILMSGFGYDPGHSIVKARQAGLMANAVLYKPFRLDQLLGTVDMVIQSNKQLTST